MNARYAFCVWITFPFCSSVFTKIYSKILVSSILLSMCTGFTLNHAITALKLHEENEPIPYNYSYMHITENERFDVDNPNNTITRNRRISDFYEDLQYAPLSPGNRKKFDSTQRPSEVTTPEKYRFTEKVFHNNHRIEPHLVNYKSADSETSLIVVSGHNIAIESDINIEDSRTTTSEPFSNFFKEYDGMRISKNNNYKAYLKSSDTQKDKALIPPILKIIERQHPPGISYNTKNIFNEEFYKPINNLFLILREMKSDLQSMPDGELQVAMSSFVKTPKVHLNVARSYNIPQSAYDPQLNVLQNNINLPNIKPKQTLLRHDKRTVESKTILKPLYYSNNYIIKYI